MGRGAGAARGRRREGGRPLPHKVLMLTHRKNSWPLGWNGDTGDREVCAANSCSRRCFNYAG